MSKAQALVGVLVASLTAGLLGCSHSSGTAPSPRDAVPTTSETNPAHAALFDLTINPSTLSAEVTPVRTVGTQPPQNLRYDLDIAEFLSPDTLQVAGVQLDVFRDIVVDIQHRHPFPAPNFANPITALNRADLGYTGRLFVLAETEVHEYEPGIALDRALVRAPDGWANPGDLLRNGAGLTATYFPYVLLADDGENNREGVSNGGMTTGNYSAASGGWQRENAGASGDQWTGYDYLHGGQSAVNQLSFHRLAMEAADWTVRLAIVIQYTDPRGQASRNARFPSSPSNVAEFAYRLPYAALDVSKIAMVWDVPLRPDVAQEVPLEVRVRDWDATAIESTAATLGEEADVSKVQTGGSGVPVVTFTMDQVYTGEQTVPFISGTGIAGNALLYRMQVSNVNGAPTGNYKGLIKVADPELSDVNRGSYHFGVDPLTLTPSAARRLEPLTVRPIQFQVPYDTEGWSVGWGEYQADRSESIAVDGLGNVVVAGHYRNEAFDMIPGDSHTRIPWRGARDLYIVRFTEDGVPAGSLTIGGAGEDSMESVELDSDGNFVIFFSTDSPSLDVDPGAGVTDLGSDTIHYGVAKYSPATGLLWALNLPETTVPGPANTDWHRMTQSPDNDLLFGGRYEGTGDFDPGPGEAFRTSHNGGVSSDAVLLRLTGAGAFEWVHVWGNANDTTERINAIVCTPTGDVVAGGSLGDQNSDGSGTIDLDPSAGEDLRPSHFLGTPFYVRLADDGTYQSGQAWLRQGTAPDPSAFGHIDMLALDATGRIYVRGGYAGTGDFDPGAGEFSLTSLLTEFPETFTASYDTDNGFRWAFPYFGQAPYGPEDGELLINSNGDLVSIATFSGTDETDFDPGPGEATMTTGGLIYNQYLASYTTDGDFRYVFKWGSLADQVVTDIAPTPDGRLVLSGTAHTTLSQLDPRGFHGLLNVIGATDAFYMNLSADCEW